MDLTRPRLAAPGSWVRMAGLSTSRAAIEAGPDSAGRVQKPERGLVSFTVQNTQNG